MDVLAQYDWLFFIGLLAVAILLLWARDAARAGHDSRERDRVTRRALVFFFWLGLPWFVVGAGTLLSDLKTSDDFLDLRNQPWSAIFIASVLAVWVALLRWLFFRGGAEELADSGHLLFGFWRIRDPDSVKLLFVAMLLGGLLGLTAAIIAATG